MKVGAFVVSLVLALAVPCIALAANTASFSGAAPGSGASISVYKPTIMVTVYDKYGVTGSANYSLTLDGVKKSTTITRSLGWGNRKFKLSYAVPSDLSLGRHTVSARVKDVKGKVSTYSWSFTVLDGTAPVTTSDAQLNYLGSAAILLHATDNVGVTHTYYTVDLGGQTEGTSIEVSGVGFHVIQFWSVDAAGNVEMKHTVGFMIADTIAMSHALPTNLTCTTILGCHSTLGTASDIASLTVHPTADLPKIHNGNCFACHGAGVTPSNNCVTCHGANGPHGQHIVVAAAGNCTTCHDLNPILQIHDLGNGASPCETCHNSSRPDVQAAIANGTALHPATCETCHGNYDHVAAAGTHHDTAPFSAQGCFLNGCHTAPDASVIHASQITTPQAGPTPPNCPACHGAHAQDARVTNVSCTQTGCHDDGSIDAIHPDILPGLHVSTDSCTTGNAATCHVPNVLTIHTTTLPGGPAAPGCIACHAAGVTPSTVCADCHGANPHAGTTGGVPAVAAHDALQTEPNACFNSNCHPSNDVSIIHTTWVNPPGCVACHAPAKAAVLAANLTACVPCHSNGIHNNLPAAHSSTMAAGCLGSSCHGTPSLTNPVEIGDEHAHWGVGCPECHASTDARVIAAITAGPTGDKTCSVCHSGTGSNPNLNNHFHGAEFTAATNASGHNVAGNLINGFAIGAKTRFDGTQGVTLMWEAEETTTLAGFADGRNGTYVTGQIATMTTQWDFPTANVFWSANSTEAPATAIKGLTANSTVMCTDCHDAAAGIQASGPHGSTQTWALDPNYPGDYSYAELTKYVTANLAYVSGGSQILDAVRYAQPLSASGIAMFPGAATHADITSASVASTATVPGWVPGVSALGNRTDGTTGATAVICAKCHDLENYNPLSNAVEGSNTAHDSHHQDQLDGSAQCVNCHVGIPHGWVTPRLLVDTDVDSAPYLDPHHLGTTRATSTGSQNTSTTGAGAPDTRKLTPGFGQGFNGQGMQGLSGVNNHTLGGPNGEQPYGTGDGLPTAVLNPGHTGMAYWAEPQCQGCGDHPGETPAQIIRN